MTQQRRPVFELLNLFAPQDLEVAFEFQASAFSSLATWSLIALLLMALLFDAFFGAAGEAETLTRLPARKSKKRSKGSEAAASAKRRCCTRPRKGPGSERFLGWFDLAQLTKASRAEVLQTPPSGPIRLGSDFTGYGTDSLACHFLAVPYEVAFVAEKSLEKDTLRTALEAHVTHKAPQVKYSDVRKRCSKEAPACDVFITGPPCVAFSSLGKGKGTSASQGRLMEHSMKYIVSKLPRVVIIENVRGLTFKQHRGLLQHVKDCLQAMGYDTHVRVLCTSDSAVPQSRGRCYVVAIRSPKHPFKWPKTLPSVKLEHFLDTTCVKAEHSLNHRQKTVLRKLQEKHNHRLETSWFCYDAGASWSYVQCLKDKCPCLTRSRSSGHYLPKLRRFISVLEHGSLQGLPHSATRYMVEAANGDERVVRAALGDAMSLNVLMRVLGKALYSAGLVAAIPSDPWQQLAKDITRCNLHCCGARVLPDAYLQGGGGILK